MEALILSNVQINERYYKLSLKLPGPLHFVPGQFVMIKSYESFADPLLPRPFSIYKENHDATIEILYTVVGKGTELLSLCKEGGSINITGPLGNGFPLRPAERVASIFIVAGGIGVAPLVSLVERLRNMYEGKEILFFLGGRSKEDLLCVEEIGQSVSTLIIATNDGSEGMKGYVTHAFEEYLEKQYQNDDQLLVYACGPIPMLQKIMALTHNRTGEKYFSIESPMACGTGLCMGCAVETIDGRYYLTCKDGPVFQADRIKLKHF